MSQVLTQIESGVLEVALNRPEKKNALTQGMYSDMAQALRAAKSDPEIRAVLFYGYGGNFTSGNDLMDFIQNPPDSPDTPVMQFIHETLEFEKPIVVVVQGYAVGLGTTFLLHADLVYAAESARFQLPFVNLGLVPEFGATFLLPRMLGNVRASEVILLGDVFGPDQALEMGLVNAIFPDHEILAQAREKARVLASKPASSVMATKRLLRAPDRDLVLQAVAEEGVAFAEQLASPEFAEAAQAFFKRKS